MESYDALLNRLSFNREVPHDFPKLGCFHKLENIPEGVTTALQIKFQKQSGEVLVLLNGTLDGSTACEIEHAIQPLLEGGHMRVVFDFSEVRKVEYFGVAIFAKVMRSQRNQFSDLTFAGLRPAVQKLFKRFGLPGSHLPLADSLREATKSEVPIWQTS